MLTAKRLRKVLSYAPTTGIFRWKVSASSRAPVGAIAGAKNGRGYHQIRIGGRPYSASRLAWLYMTGKWPNSEISYVNGKPPDTRWANLREAPFGGIYFLGNCGRGKPAAPSQSPDPPPTPRKSPAHRHRRSVVIARAASRPPAGPI